MMAIGVILRKKAACRLTLTVYITFGLSPSVSRVFMYEFLRNSRS